jgi:hypothetical protein
MQQLLTVEPAGPILGPVDVAVRAPVAIDDLVDGVEVVPRAEMEMELELDDDDLEQVTGGLARIWLGNGSALDAGTSADG